LPGNNKRKVLPVGGAATAAVKPAIARPLHRPDAPNALVLDPGQDGVRAPVVVDPVLGRELRPHQREGVKFLFQCVTGKSDPTRMGCILADEMGLGKSLQCIALTWTLLKQGSPRGGPAIKKACVVCPSSLVSNWEKEFRKWLGRERIRSLAVDPKLEDIAAKIEAFHTDKLHHVIIISYELYRKHAKLLNKTSTIDLLLCDEGHRLKSSATNKTIAALNAAPTKRRVIITGTPVQNDLEEFYSMCDFVNPSCLGGLALFRRIYATPILASRDAAASAEASNVGQQRSEELNTVTQSFMLRRDASINKVRATQSVIHRCHTKPMRACCGVSSCSNRGLAFRQKHLPLKVELFVFCRLAPLQRSLYAAVLKSKALQRVFSRGSGSSTKGFDHSAYTLTSINFLRKICNHPALVHPSTVEADSDLSETSFSTQLAQSGANLFQDGFSARDASLSGKLCVLQALLQQGKAIAPTERWVIISNFTKTLDLISDLCNDWGHTTLRLDGSTASSDRNSLVERFNSNGEATPSLTSHHGQL
jgi:SNF2 family DNA or RNA helicase